MKVGETDFSDPRSVGEWVKSVAEQRGLRERRAAFLEYWLQVELWRALKDRAGDETVFDCEPPYWTIYPVTGKGNWKGADIGAATNDGKLCLFIEMKHLMWRPRSHKHHVRQVAKDIKAVMGLDLTRTVEGLSKGEITQAGYSDDTVALFKPWAEKWRGAGAVVGFIGLVTPREGTMAATFQQDVRAQFSGTLSQRYDRIPAQIIPLWGDDSLIVWSSKQPNGSP